MKNLAYCIALLSVLVAGASCNKTFNCQCKNDTGIVTYNGTLKSHSAYTARPYCDQHGSENINCTVY